jgi:hypothetical protein
MFPYEGTPGFTFLPRISEHYVTFLCLRRVASDWCQLVVTGAGSLAGWDADKEMLCSYIFILRN